MDDAMWPVAAPVRRDDAVVWNVDLAPCAARYADCARILSPEERTRAARFVRSEDRHRFVASHAALRLVLAGALGARPDALVFGTDAGGKPRLDGAFAGSLHFNLSHSGSRALVGLATTPIGVDIEAMRPIADHLRIARGHFHPHEIATIAALPTAERQAGFYACWTRKEAFVKAVGAGLSMPLDSFAVSLPPASPALLSREGDPGASADWTLHHLEPTEGFVGAVAIARGDARCDRFRLADDWPDRLPRI